MTSIEGHSWVEDDRASVLIPERRDQLHRAGGGLALGRGFHETSEEWETKDNEEDAIEEVKELIKELSPSPEQREEVERWLAQIDLENGGSGLPIDKEAPLPGNDR